MDVLLVVAPGLADSNTMVNRMMPSYDVLFDVMVMPMGNHYPFIMYVLGEARRGDRQRSQHDSQTQHDFFHFEPFINKSRDVN